MKMTREKAIQTTDSVLRNLTYKKAYQIFVEECECQIDMLNQYVWNEYNVGGWYYDDRGCFEIIVRHYLEKSMINR